LLSGAISLDIAEAAGERGAATAAGVVDAVGYVGASLAAFVLGSVSKRAGWTAAFDVVFGMTFAALVLAVVWNVASARDRNRNGAKRATAA
jgi:sugar phosphate permease